MPTLLHLEISHTESFIVALPELHGPFCFVLGTLDVHC